MNFLDHKHVGYHPPAVMSISHEAHFILNTWLLWWYVVTAGT